MWGGPEDFADPKTMSERPDLKRLLFYTKALEAQSTVILAQTY